MSFAVTGLGRCGTKKFARLLASDPEWTVKWQNDADHIRRGYTLPGFWKRFLQKSYGEVSCALLPVLLVLPVDRRMVILRDLKDTAVSAVNYSAHVRNKRVPLIEQLPETLAMLDRTLELDNKVFRVPYEELFQCDKVLLQAASNLGVQRLQSLDLKTFENSTPKVVWKFEDLSLVYRKIVDSCRWFEEKWRC